MDNLIDTLEARGFIESMTGSEIKNLVNQPISVYCGFDPTADSLHLGNMVGLMGLRWFQKFGATSIALLGGATGMIGDPSGKAKERSLLDKATLEKNISGIQKDIEKIVPGAVLLNNYDWFEKFSFVDFLRDVGKHFRVGPMLAKESVRSRLESEEGMSFTEFSYQLLQGYDFLYLFQNHNVTMQIGGSDQWGNITAGKELVRKVKGKNVHGLTFPLLTTGDGKKFGKTEKGAIWLSSEKLSPYDFYQHLFRIGDEDVIRFMKMLTFMELDEINAIERQMKHADYLPNTAQRRLAEEVTRLVHGDEGVSIAEKITAHAAPGKVTELNETTLKQMATEIPCHERLKEELIEKPLIEVTVATSMIKSKGEAKRLIRGGGLYLNNEKVSDENQIINESDLISGEYLLFAIGKKRKEIIHVSNYS